MKDFLTKANFMEFHMGIYAIIEKEESILLVKKARGPYLGMWDLPGGRPIHGETIFQTLEREVKEETNIQLIEAEVNANFAFVVTYQDGEKLISLHHTALIYKAIKFNDSCFCENIIEEDVAGSSWIKKSELIHLPISKVVSCII